MGVSETLKGGCKKGRRKGEDTDVGRRKGAKRSRATLGLYMDRARYYQGALLGFVVTIDMRRLYGVTIQIYTVICHCHLETSVLCIKMARKLRIYGMTLNTRICVDDLSRHFPILIRSYTDRYFRPTRKFTSRIFTHAVVLEG